MTVLGWIVISLLLSFVGYLVFNLIKEYAMNRKLNTFKVKNKLNPVKLSHLLLVKKAYQIVLATMLIVVVGVSGVFSNEIRLENNKIMTQASVVGSKAKLLSLIKTQDYRNNVDTIFPEAMFDSTAGEEKSRDFINTNTQVSGVDEADIIKTDGNYIYYASRYYQKINVVYVNDNYEAVILKDIDLGDVYTENLYLTDDYVVVIGYTYQVMPYRFNEGDLYFGWVYQEPTGTVMVIDRSSYEVVYKIETDSYFHEHRVIDNVMYLVSNKYVNSEDDELRPKFTETKGQWIKTTYVGYDDIYYYNDVSASSMTVVTSINLSDFSYKSQSFIGYVDQVYATKDNIYTAYNYYDYSLNGQWTYTTQILKFKINSKDSSISYQGGQLLEGSVNDSYWMDEYDGYFRVVTSSSWPAKNRLYVLEEDLSKDVLNIVSTIDKDLGLEGETVKSVRFNKDYAQIVTFKQTDPLYTVDLTNPLKPIIKDNPIKEEGYNTYMHVWNEDHLLIGFGFDATSDGRVTGLKLSAYDTNYDLALETYSFADDEKEGYTYSYSEAIYNPKALMIDASKGIIGFPINTYSYSESEGSSYLSSFVIFFIDFNSENIISDPIMINHENTDYYMSIDRGIYIENILNNQVTDRYIYTFSYQQVVVYHLETNTVIQKEILNEALNAYNN